MKEQIKKPLKWARRFYGYLKKDLMLFYKRRKYLYMFILFPILIALIFLFLLSPTQNDIPVGVCNLDDDPRASEVFSELDGFEPELLPKENCKENLLNRLKKGDFSLGLEIPRDFSSNLENLRQSRINVYYDNTDIAFSNLVSWRVDSALEPFKRQIIYGINQELKKRVKVARGSLDIFSNMSENIEPVHTKIVGIDEDLEKVEELDTEFLVNPIWTNQKGIYDTAELKNVSIVFLYPILALFLILMLASTSLIYDRKTGFLTKAKTSVSLFTYLLAKLVFFFILSLIIFLIIYIIFFVSGARYNFQIIEILKLILSITLINSLIGLLIGQISENEGIAILISLIISFPLMLLSGLFFPIQTMPSFIQLLINILPLHYQIEASKAVILFGESISRVWSYFALALFAIVFFLIRRQE